MIPADIVMSVSTLSSVKVETPEEALMFDVIKSGNLASSIVPSVILAPLAKLVAVVAVPVTSPVTTNKSSCRYNTGRHCNCCTDFKFGKSRYTRRGINV